MVKINGMTAKRKLQKRRGVNYMHPHTRTDVRGNQKTEVISFCAKWYRQTHTPVNGCGKFWCACWLEFISRCAWWPSRNLSNQAWGELNGSWNKLAGGRWKLELSLLLGKLRTEGDPLESQCSSVFQEVPSSLDPIPVAFSPPSPAPYAACALAGVQAVQVPPAAEPSLIVLREAKSHFSVGHQPSILAAGRYLTLNFVLTVEF